MIRLLAISGSPVENASTDLILAEIANSIVDNIKTGEPIDSQFIKLNALKFIPCQACGKAPTPNYCFFEDDLTAIYPKIAACDCLLFGSPVYFDSVSGQAKMFIDRCNCFRPYDFNKTQTEHNFIKLLSRKRPGAIVLVGGDDIGFEGARRTIAGFFKWIELVNHGVIKYRSDDDRRSGTAQNDPAIIHQAREMGAKLATAILKDYERPRNG